MSFPYKTEPFKHQRDTLNMSATREFFALHLEQGLGKTKVLLDNAAFLFLRGKITGLLVVAPNGVHTNWAEEEIPKHLSDSVPRKVVEWASSKASNKGFQRDLRELNEFKGLSILCMNIEAIRTSRGKEAAKEFLNQRVCMMAIDESTDIKTPGASQSKAAHTLGRLARYRRNMTGTPAGDGTPFDTYSQFKFLSPGLLGTSFTSFKNQYAEMIPAPWHGAPKHLRVVKKYKNLDRLNRIISEHSIRLTKDELIAKGELDIPEKLYNKHFIELTPAQKRMYSELHEEYITQFEGSEGYVTAPMTLVRYLRLQQIVQGYVPVDDEEPLTCIPGPNPRLDAVGVFLEHNPGKVIIWSRFRMDAELIMEKYAKEYVLLRYDGSRDQKEEAKHRFQNDTTVRGILCNAASAGRGLTLNRARHVLIYSNYFGLEDRLQLEDRAHRIGLMNPVLYTDFVARGTIDVKIVNALRNKKNVSDTITGDPRKDWI